MSVTTSSANVNHPPLLFGQRSPSPPNFSSPPQSPNHIHHTQTPLASPPPQPAEDVDMNASTTLQGPDGQNHDREDEQMQDSEGLTNGVAESNAVTRELPTANVAVEVSAVDEDVMDTTPDHNQESAPPAASTGSNEVTMNGSAPNGVSPDGDTNAEQPPPPADNEISSEIGTLPQILPHPPVEPNVQPPATDDIPPPEPVQSDSDSSDDEGGQPWHPIHEDHSTPDEAELKEIEEAGEISALDHEYWEKRAFLPLDEPEYTPGASGKVEWLVDHYNGTKENPNREIVMKSPSFHVGGHEWQIKFYPKGNDTDYLSVYIECLSVGGQGKDDTKPVEEAVQKEGESMETEEPAQTGPLEFQHAPLPLLDSKPVPKRRSVAAQISVVMYNPTEPRVNTKATSLHRFCANSPDWGWTRFHGPYYDIAQRNRGQRQALLRDDKLAFTGYIRIINDETNCLWEHPSGSNQWNSFAMTGLQSLTLGQGCSTPGGNMISAITSWILFRPFRTFLENFKVPHPYEEPLVRPKPLIAALQKLLYLLRTRSEPETSAVALDDVLDALEWYGIHDRLDKLDVVEVWGVLRYKLEEELEGTSYAAVLEDLFGKNKDYVSGVPSYRVPVQDVGSIQNAIERAPDCLHPTQTLPQLLTVELKRQDFDIGTRSYVKLLNRVSLDDHITVRGTSYTLYGFVVHRQTLQSYLYHPVLRPEGPGSKWYKYTDGKEENVVRCLPKRQAVDYHEGKPGTGKVTGNDPVAYIAMYARDDIATAAFSSTESEPWSVPEWLRDEVTKPKEIIPPIPDEEPKSDAPNEIQEKVDILSPKVHEFQVIDSRVFLQHEGSGIIDVYDPKWRPETCEHVHTVTLSSTDNFKEVRSKLASVIKEVEDPRQVKFWFLDAMRGTVARPHLLSTGLTEFSSGGNDSCSNRVDAWLQEFEANWTSYRIWVHIINVADLPELPKPEPSLLDPPQNTSPSPSTTQAPDSNNSTEPTEDPPQNEASQDSEDTPMSEPDAPAPPTQNDNPEQQIQPPASNNATDTLDTQMDENVASNRVPRPIFTEPPIPPVAVDTDMGGTHDISTPPPPPPPPADWSIPPPVPEPQTNPPQEGDSSAQAELSQEPEPVPAEIYFFLKFFDAETQTLTSRGSHIALKSARVEVTILSLLGLPPDKKIDMYEEEELTTTHTIRPRRSFAQNDLHNAAILVATFPLTEEQRNALAERAAFADLQSFLEFQAHARNFPTKVSGHFTIDNFSSQYYKGEVKNGHRHGHGTRIYHSGATYVGSFRLSQRHGHGLYTFQNGDTYDGEWCANQQHGTGTFVEAATGNTYVGGWKNDKKFGEGVTHWKNAQETERLCRICWEESAEAAFYDCGHVVACIQCARQVDNCPVCRKRVLSAMKLYYVA